MLFLHSHGVGTARAVRIYKTYGSDAVQVMSKNRGGPGYLNSFSASISGASAGVRLPCGEAAW
jgi:hypothetical protein